MPTEQVVESRAFSDPRLHEGSVRRAALNQSLVGWVAAHRTMIEVPDVFADPRYLRSATDWWEKHGLTSFVGVPIIQDGRLLGVLSFVSARPLRLGAGERELLDTLVGQAALAMRNARLFAATEGREREAAALFDITRRLGATLDSRARSCGSCPRAPPRPWTRDVAGFFRWDEASQRLVVAGGQMVARARRVAARSARARASSGRAFAERRVCWTDDRWRTRRSGVFRGQRGRDRQERVGARLHRRARHSPGQRLRRADDRHTEPHTHTEAEAG